MAVLFGLLVALTCAGCGAPRPVSYPMPASHAARPAMPLSGKTSGRFQSRIVSWQELKSRNVVIQDLDYSCGAAALATLLQFYFRDNVSEEQLLDRILAKLTDEAVKDREKNGLSMDDLFEAAKSLGYHAAVVKMPVEKLPKLPAPVIVRIEKDDYKHFVVLRGMAEDRVFLADPIRGNIRISLHSFLKQWSGEALVLGKAGFGLPKDHPLAVRPQHPVRNELSTARRFLYRTP